MLATDFAPALPAALDAGEWMLGTAMIGGLGALIARLLGWLRPQPVPVPIPVPARGARRPLPRRR